MKNPFEYTDKDLYELMDAQGKKRFGSECKHEKVVNGKCANCLRKVIARKKSTPTELMKGDWNGHRWLNI